MKRKKMSMKNNLLSTTKEASSSRHCVLLASSSSSETSGRPEFFLICMFQLNCESFLLMVEAAGFWTVRMTVKLRCLLDISSNFACAIFMASFLHLF